MSGHPKRWLPAAIVVVAVAAMAVAARRNGGLDAGVADGLWKDGRPAVTALTVVVLVVIAANFAKHRDSGYGLLHRAGTATAVVLFAAALFTPIGLALFGRQPGTDQRIQQDDGPTKSLTRKTRPGVTQTFHSEKPHLGLSAADMVVLGVLSLIVLSVLAILVYSVIRLLQRLRITRQAVPLLDFEPLGMEIDQLAEAVAAGAEALEYRGDAREAVIACYSAMEQAVSASGGGRRATDTPEDFLRRVTAAQLAPEEPARRLTELFREARFSRHPIAESHREAAREALRAISEHLRQREEALAAKTAEARARASAQTAGGA